MQLQILSLGDTSNFIDHLQEAHSNGTFFAFIQKTAETGILFEAIPQLRGLHLVPQDPRWHPEGDVWTHTLLVLKHLPAKATFAMSLAALLHDIGKATTTIIQETGAISARGHESVSAEMAQSILSALNANEQLISDVVFLVRHHMTAHNPETNARTLRRLMREGGRDLVEQLLQHGVADVSGGSRNFAACEKIREIFDHLEDEPEKPCAVLSGDEVMELTGLPPGPEVGSILHALAALGNVDRETAIKFVHSTQKQNHR